jgi:phosphoribosyl-ATP pyrophosphohydrolase/phosphoribosyl-AMP cyclohydrolase
MLGYVNREALEKTLLEGKVTFWSRSRKTLWTKGETSGNFLFFEGMATDCDHDTLLVRARPQGPTCHKGTVSCFTAEQDFAGLTFLSHLEKLITERCQNHIEGSYTAQLFQNGTHQITKKLGEEAVELLLTVHESPQRTVAETADFLYHLLVFLQTQGVRLSQVVEELRSRHVRGRSL